MTHIFFDRRTVHDRTIDVLSVALASGKTTSSDLVARALRRALDPGGEGERVFVRLWADEARLASRGYDVLRAANVGLSPLAGLPISLKDNFDVKGEVTTAGSPALSERAPATRDSIVVQRLRQAGAVLVGRTNMSELAFSGVGVNPHYGTPLNAYDRQSRRIPGGSSSGAAVSVQDGMSVAAIGTDTGGSVRIPAALCGLVGFKATQARIPLGGVLPLSPTLDAVGSIAATVADCGQIDEVLSGDTSDRSVSPPQPLRGRRFCILGDYLLSGLDKSVQDAFNRAVEILRMAGAQVVEIPSNYLARIATLNSLGTFPAIEGWNEFRDVVRTSGNLLDPRIRRRLEKGRDVTAATFLEIQRERSSIVECIHDAIRGFDAIIGPTVPIVAPKLDDVAEDESFDRINLLLLRNTAVANILDRPSISIPCHRQGEAPVGLMLIGEHLKDREMLSSALAIETEFERVFYQ